MKKQKWIVLILAMVMVWSLLAGCQSREDVAGQVTPNADESQGKPVSLGRLEGGVYVNSYTGYGCDLSEDWTFYSAEELQQLPENTSQLLEGTELEDAVLQNITDMMAENVNDMTTMNVLYQKLGMQERLLYAALSDDALLDEMLNTQYDMMVTSYAQAGIEVSSMEKVKVSFLGEERTALKTVSTIQGMDYYVLQIFDFDLGSYSVTLTASSFVEDKTQDILDLFYAVE